VSSPVRDVLSRLSLSRAHVLSCPPLSAPLCPVRELCVSCTRFFCYLYTMLEPGVPCAGLQAVLPHQHRPGALLSIGVEISYDRMSKAS